MQSKLRKLLSGYNIHPRRWVNSFFTYRKYMGYIRPQIIKNNEDEYHVRRKIFDRCWEPQALKIPVGKKIVVIAPHADDESIGAGGFLWAHRNMSELHIVLLTQGDKGGNLDGCSSENKDYSMQLSQKRHNEFMRTAEMIGAVTYNLDYAEEEIPCTIEAAKKIRDVVQKINPDLVLIPWLFDNLPDHRRTNILYAWGCADLELMVLAYEIWTMLDANAILDITDYIDGKVSMIKNYESQLRTVDYLTYAVALSKVRAYRYPVRDRRQGAVEAYIALPNIEYCELVQNYYGRPGAINTHVLNVINKY